MPTDDPGEFIDAAMISPDEQGEDDSATAGGAPVEPAQAGGSSGPTSGVAPGALLQMLSGGGVDPLALLLSQMTGKGSDNPSTALLSQFLQQRAAPAPAANEREDDDQAKAESAARLAELVAMVESLYAETERLRVRTAELADALGACPVCFGSDLLCSRCGGRGRPGGRAPKPEAYRAYVVPAVMRVRRLAETHRGGDPPAAPRRVPSNSVADQGAGYARQL